MARGGLWPYPGGVRGPLLVLILLLASAAVADEVDDSVVEEPAELPPWAPFIAALDCPASGDWIADRPRRGARMTALHARRERWELDLEAARAARAQAEIAVGAARRSEVAEAGGGDSLAAAEDKLSLRRAELRDQQVLGVTLDFLLDVAAWELDTVCPTVARARTLRRERVGRWPYGGADTLDPEALYRAPGPCGTSLIPCYVLEADARRLAGLAARPRSRTVPSAAAR